jgi:sensor histidine kinase YesM
LKLRASHFRIGFLIIGFFQVIGWILNLFIGVRFSGIALISSEIVIIDSLAMGFTVLISLYFTSILADKSERVTPPLLLSFGLLLGTSILTATGFFLANPVSFLYAENRTIPYLLINLLFSISVNVIVNGFVIFQRRITAREQALNEEKSLKTEMEKSLLASKINPHFLFNSLNMMVSLLKTPEKAETALIHLSDILRYQLDFSEAETVSLEEELKVVEKYLALQEMRFGERLEYEITGTTHGRIPPMILQPLVENSIKHNMGFIDHLRIRLSVKEKGDYVRVFIVDSLGAVKPEMLDKGVGLTVTRKRIELYGGQFIIKNGGIEISFKL